jgi:DNA-binding beta-propeller fold protein YncE
MPRRLQPNNRLARLGRFGALSLVLAALLTPARAPTALAIDGPISLSPIVVNDFSDKTGGIEVNMEDNKCSLREALEAARTNQPVNDTEFAAQPGSGQPDCPAGQADVPDLISFAGAGSITLKDEIWITEDVAILGPVSISGGGTTRIFRITGEAKVAMTGVVFTNGNATGGSGGAILVSGGELNLAGGLFIGNISVSDGGAIGANSSVVRLAGVNFTNNRAEALNGPAHGGAVSATGAGELIIAGGAFEGNSAVGGMGGAIFNTTPKAEISDALFLANVAQGDPNSLGGGGAIANHTNGKLTLTRALLSGNLSPSGRGGGIFNNISGNLTVRDSALLGNLAGKPPSTEQRGGGIANFGALTLVGSTLMANAAFGEGGGLSNDRGGDSIVANSTFIANAASNNGGAIENVNTNQGGPAGSTVVLRNSTLSANVRGPLGKGHAIFTAANQETSAGNTIIAHSPDNDHCDRTLVSLGSNIDSGATCFSAGGSDRLNTDPKLDGPAFNGGPISQLTTLKPKLGSPAEEQGNAAICAAEPVKNLDQRGEARPADGDGDGSAACDIGAIESEARSAGMGSDPAPNATLHFGSVFLGQSRDRTVTVQNTGEVTLTVSAALGGADAAEYSLPQAAPLVVPGGQSGTITVRCAPGVLSTRSAKLTLSSNDPQRPTSEYSLICLGANEPQASFGSSPAAPGPIDFGTGFVGQTRLGTLTVEELGNAALTLASGQISGPDADEFSLTTSLPASLADGDGPLDLALSCAPATPGLRSATLTIATNDPQRPSINFGLSCTGVAPPPANLAAPGFGADSAGSPGQNGPRSMALSPDGRHLYVLDDGDKLLARLDRDPATGALEYKGAILLGLSGIADPRRVTLSPDGKALYITSASDGKVVSYSRNAETGILVRQGTLAEGDEYGFCMPDCPFALDGLLGADDVAISPDGNFGYVSSGADAAVVVVNRIVPTGTLTLDPLSGPVQVFRHASLAGAGKLAFSPDGNFVYLADAAGDKLLVLSRGGDGRLTHLVTYEQGQLVPFQLPNGQPGFITIDGLGAPSDIAVSPDGRFVYVSGYDSSAVAIFERNLADGKLRYRGRAKDGQQGFDGLAQPRALAISPDGGYLYVAGAGENALAVLARNPESGGLSFNQVLREGQGGAAPQLSSPFDVTASADGRFVYVAAYGANKIVGLPRANPTPVLENLSPASRQAGSGDATLTLQGSGFVSGAQVSFNGTLLAAELVGAGELRATLPGALLAAAGSATVKVVNPGPGGGESGGLSFTISAPGQNPVPALTGLSPEGATAGSPALTLLVAGSGFIAGSEVLWNGQPLSTTFATSSTLQATLPATLLTEPGTSAVAVRSPAPGGGTSNALAFAVGEPGTNPLPTLSGLSPSELVASSASGTFTLVARGAGFVPGAKLRWQGQLLPTTYVDAGELRAEVDAGRVATAGVFEVTAENPAPGGGESQPVSLSVLPLGATPRPSVASVGPPLEARARPLWLTIAGAGFAPGAQASFNGVALQTSFVGAGELRALVPAMLLRAEGAASLVVTNPDGAASDAVLLEITARGPTTAFLPLVAR